MIGEPTLNGLDYEGLALVIGFGHEIVLGLGPGL